jgi:hypothetical protein
MMNLWTEDVIFKREFYLMVSMKEVNDGLLALYLVFGLSRCFSAGSR